MASDGSPGSEASRADGAVSLSRANLQEMMCAVVRNELSRRQAGEGSQKLSGDRSGLGGGWLGEVGLGLTSSTQVLQGPGGVTGSSPHLIALSGQRGEALQSVAHC